MTRILLFLCTGNYYRSRFAEVLFNLEAQRRGLAWVAESRAIAIELGRDNVGPLSVHAFRGIHDKGIAFDGEPRFPIQVQENDLAGADMIIAMNETEHRPMLRQRFPAWADAVGYWHVPDVEFAAPSDALALIEEEVARLILKLQAQNGNRGANTSGSGQGV